MIKEKWVDRKFDFNFDCSIYPNFISRLEATPDLLDFLILSIPGEYYIIKDDNDWSIQENVGHLITVDDLFIGRLDDYESGVLELRPADVSGSRTNKVIYNKSEMKKLLMEFREKRMKYINRLEKTNKKMFEKKCWHPRLKQDMRLCDMLYFHAEHDDHHLEKIRQIQEKLIKLPNSCFNPTRTADGKPGRNCLDS